MNLQWMKTKIPQALMTPEIDVERWTFLHPLDAAHATLMGFFSQTNFAEAEAFVHKNVTHYCK